MLSWVEHEITLGPGVARGLNLSPNLVCVGSEGSGKTTLLNMICTKI